RIGQDDAAGHADRRGEPDPYGGPPAHVPVTVLAPGSDRGDRDDGRERGGLRLEMREADHERQRRHEQDAAADAEHPREGTCGKPEQDSEEERHPASSRTPMPRRRTLSSPTRSREDTLRCSHVPATVPATAGSPTMTASVQLTSPSAPKETMPKKAVMQIAASEVPVASAAA